MVNLVVSTAKIESLVLNSRIDNINLQNIRLPKSLFEYWKYIFYELGTKHSLVIYFKGWHLFNDCIYSIIRQQPKTIMLHQLLWNLNIFQKMVCILNLLHFYWSLPYKNQFLSYRQLNYSIQNASLSFLFFSLGLATKVPKLTHYGMV